MYIYISLTKRVVNTAGYSSCSLFAFYVESFKTTEKLEKSLNISLNCLEVSSDSKRV